MGKALAMKKVDEPKPSTNPEGGQVLNTSVKIEQSKFV